MFSPVITDVNESLSATRERERERGEEEEEEEEEEEDTLFIYGISSVLQIAFHESCDILI